MIIVDSPVWAAYLAGVDDRSTDILEMALLEEQDVGIVADTIPEILGGLKSDADYRRVKNTILKLPVLSPSLKSRVDAAQLGRTLKSKRVRVARPISLLLSQASVEFGAPVLSTHADFAKIAKHSGMRLLSN